MQTHYRHPALAIQTPLEIINEDQDKEKCDCWGWNIIAGQESNLSEPIDTTLNETHQ